MIELRQLAALLAVAEHGGFSAAAKALYTVQSNVSAHVQHLERELGVILVDRARGQLTNEGEVVAERARRIRSELDAIKLDVLALAGEVSGDVRVGVIGSTARWLVPGLLERLRQDHPRVRAVVVEASTTSLLPQLATGRLDLAIVNLPVTDGELTSEALFDEDLVLIVPGDHPLAHREQVDLVELGDHPLIVSPPGNAVRDELDEALRQLGQTLKVQAEIDGMRLMASLAFEGFGPAILPATAVPGWLQGEWRRVPVTGLPRRQVGVVRRRRGLPSAPARALAAVLATEVRVLGASQPGLHLVDR